MFSIIISEKGGAERRQLFDQSDVSVGRVQGNDLVLPKGNVSKRHCRLELIDGRFVVTDQNSTNGTYLNRRRISQSTVVRQGDRIYIGDFILRIEDGAVDGAVPATGPSQPSAPGTPASPSVAPVASVQAPSPTHMEPPKAPPLPADLPARQAVPTPGSAHTTATAAATEDRSVASRPQVGAETDETQDVLIHAVRFVVERVVSQTSPAELASGSASHRVEPMIEAVVKELEGDSLLASPDRAALIRQLARAELIELGPLSALLEDPAVSEIAASGAGYLCVVRGSHKPEVVTPFCAQGSLERAIDKLCAREGAPLKPSERNAHRFLPACGFELEVTRGELTPGGALVHMRRRAQVASNMDDLVRSGTISRTIANFLQQCVLGSANILVVGNSRSGALDVVAGLAASMNDERAVVLADDGDIAAPNSIPLREGRGIDLQTMLAEASRLPGHRLVVDGFGRRERAAATLRVVADGAQGVIARFAARSIERGLAQLCAQLSIGNSGLSPTTFADALVATFDVVLEVARLADGRSRVVRVAELSRGESAPIVADDIFGFTVERIATGGAVEGSFIPTGRRPTFEGELRLRGARVDSGMFGRARAPYPSR